MSQGSSNIIRSGRVIVGATAASAVLLLGVWLALRGRGPAPEEATPAIEEPALAAATPPRADAFPRRDITDDVDLPRSPAVLPATATVEDRLQALADRPPPPPPDPAVMAAQVDHAAAVPVAMAALAEALAGRRSALRRACAGKGASSTLYVTASFGADGKLGDHSVTDDGTNPAVAECVQGQLSSLSIAPPGVAVMTRATLDLN